MGDQQSLLALQASKDISMLAIHNIKLSRERQRKKFLSHPLPEFKVGDKVLVSNHTSHLWDLKYDSAYSVVPI